MPRTTSDIIGPFYRGPMYGYAYPKANNFILPFPDPVDQNPLELTISITDAKTGARIDFATVEVWQADSNGHYDLSNPRPDDTPVEYWPNTATRRGVFRPYGRHFNTLYTAVPGAYFQEASGGTPGFWRQRHIHFRITKAGYVDLVTQVFFPTDLFSPPPPGDPYYLPQNTVQGVRKVGTTWMATFAFAL